MQRLSCAALALGCCWLAGAHAQDREQEQQPAPDLDFLEYLGTWAGDDDEWLAIEEWERDNAEDAKQRRESEGRESEKDDDDESE